MQETTRILYSETPKIPSTGWQNVGNDPVRKHLFDWADPGTLPEANNEQRLIFTNHKV
jgi:hypothetical protein